MEESEIRKAAHLARIALKNSEMESLKDKFEMILAHFNELSSVDTESVEALFHFTNEMPLVEDSPEAAVPVALLLQNAPDSFEENFRITRVVGDSEG